jgi:hypothetical protein
MAPIEIKAFCLRRQTAGGEALLERFPGARLDQLDVSILEVDHVAGVHKIGLKKNMNGMGSLAEKG